MTNQIQVTAHQQDTHCIYVCNQTGEASGLTKTKLLRFWRKDGYSTAKSEFPTYEQGMTGRMLVIGGETHITETGHQHYRECIPALDKLLRN